LFKDPDQDPDWQFSQVLSMGLVYRISK